MRRDHCSLGRKERRIFGEHTEAVNGERTSPGGLSRFAGQSRTEVENVVGSGCHSGLQSFSVGSCRAGPPMRPAEVVASGSRLVVVVGVPVSAFLLASMSATPPSTLWVGRIRGKDKMWRGRVC